MASVPGLHLAFSRWHTLHLIRRLQDLRVPVLISYFGPLHLLRLFHVHLISDSSIPSVHQFPPGFTRLPSEYAGHPKLWYLTDFLWTSISYHDKLQRCPDGCTSTLCWLSPLRIHSPWQNCAWPAIRSSLYFLLPASPEFASTGIRKLFCKAWFTEINAPSHPRYSSVFSVSHSFVLPPGLKVPQSLFPCEWNPAVWALFLSPPTSKNFLHQLPFPKVLTTLITPYLPQICLLPTNLPINLPFLCLALISKPSSYLFPLWLTFFKGLF